MTLPVGDLWDLLVRGGLPFAIFCALVASMRGNFVWGREHDALEKRRVEELTEERRQRKEDREEFERRLKDTAQERDEWKHAFLRVAGVTESLVRHDPNRPDLGGIGT